MFNCNAKIKDKSKLKETDVIWKYLRIIVEIQQINETIKMEELQNGIKQ